MKDFIPESKFQPILVDTYGDKQVDKVIFCSGKVWFTLDAKLKEAGAQGVQVVRLEELAPFPVKHVQEVLAKTDKSSAKVFYIQDEPINQGAFFFCKLYLDRILKEAGHKNDVTEYIGRTSVQSMDTGSPKLFKEFDAGIWTQLTQRLL